MQVFSSCKKKKAKASGGCFGCGKRRSTEIASENNRNNTNLGDVNQISGSEDSSESFSVDFDENSLAPPVLALRYPLAKVMNSERSRVFFKAFITKEHALDSFLLWEAFSEFRQLTKEDESKIKPLFIQIWQQFFKPTSDHQVSSYTYAKMMSVQQISDLLESSPSPPSAQLCGTVCDAVVALQAELEITDLSDLYIRFVQTSEFRKMLKSVDFFLSP